MGIAWWRLWSLQGSWNRQSMQTLGWWVAWAPWLRRRWPDPVERGRWLQREDPASNSNPWLAGLLLGARMRLEDDGLELEMAERLQRGLARALGALGDGLIWTGLRPSVVLLAAVGSAWLGLSAVVAVWILFAMVQGWLRRRCVIEGYARGVEVSKLVAHPGVHALTARLRGTGGALAGVLAGLALARPWTEPADPGLTAAIVSLLVGSTLLWRRMSPELLSILALGSWVLLRVVERLGEVALWP